MKIIKPILIIFLVVFPLILNAFCMNSCKNTSSQQGTAPEFDGFPAPPANGTRQNSDDIGDVRNSIMGNVNIRVGHEHLSINMDSNSSANTVDASVSSTIILGDMKQ